MRKTYEELNQLKQELGTDRLWSWSKINCPHNSLYEYYLKYIKHEKEDRCDSIYTTTGGITHDIIERYYNHSIFYEQMSEEFDMAWLTAFEVADLKFNRNDSTRNNSLATKYYEDLQHFFTNHIPLPNKLLLEQFITIKVGNEYFQGYIDALMLDKKNDCIHIIDWKTSSIYKGEKALNECGQLVLYAMGLHQKGTPYEKIRIGWNFLKYTNVQIRTEPRYKVSWTTVKGEEKVKDNLPLNKLFPTIKASMKAWMKNLKYSKEDIELYVESIETLEEPSNPFDYTPKDIREASHLVIEEMSLEDKTRTIERCAIGESLQANVKAQLKKYGYSEEESLEYLSALLNTNSTDCLPPEIQELYSFSDCFVYVDITDELLSKWENYIIETTTMLREKEAEYALNHDDSIWMESIEDVERNSFYFANLCAYSANKHKPYKLYLQELDKKKNNDIYDTTPTVNTEVNTVKPSSDAVDKYAEDDLSWLNDL